jgi:hypothetical protein
MGRPFSYAFGLLLMGLVMSPAFRSFTDDSYPLSTYPMFARNRSKACLSHVFGVDASGASHAVPPPLIANEEITQAQQTVRLAVRGGKRTRRELCERVAARVAESEGFEGVTRIEIVTSCYEPVGYFIDGPEPLSSKRRAACEVRR